MKSFNLISLPYCKVIIILGIICCSMAFRNPYSMPAGSKNIQIKNIQFTDTIPKNDFTINIDVSKILADIDIALSKIDFEKIANDVQLSLKRIDFAKIQKDVDASLKNIDWKKMNRDIQNSLKKIDNEKIKIEIQKSMEDARQQLNSKEFKQSMEKIKEINMNQIKEELKKAKIETEKNREQLKRELLKMKADADAKNAVIDYHFGYSKSGLIEI